MRTLPSCKTPCLVLLAAVDDSPCLRPAVEPAARSKAAAAAEAAICDRFGNPVLSTGVPNGPGRALAAAEDFRGGVPAFAFFREAAAKAQGEAGRAGGRAAAGTAQAAPQASDEEAQAGEHLSQTSQKVSCSQPRGPRRALCRLCRYWLPTTALVTVKSECLGLSQVLWERRRSSLSARLRCSTECSAQNLCQRLHSLICPQLQSSQPWNTRVQPLKSQSLAFQQTQSRPLQRRL